MASTSPWAFLDKYRGRMFAGEWPTLPEMFDISVERYADRPCFSAYDPEKVSWTYAQAQAIVRRVAAHLQGIGIEKGNKVAVTGKNSPEWAMAYLAVVEMGAIVVPIDYQLTTQEIVNLIKAGDATALFVDEEKSAELRAACPGLKAVFSLWDKGPDYILNIAQPRAAEAASSAQAAGVPASRPAEGDLAAILFTSGTMGVPKGVMLSHSNFVADCYLAQANLSISHNDVFYALLPLHHSYTMLAVLIEALSVGAEIVFGKRMVVKQILKDLKEAKVTMFLGVPLLFNKVLAGILKGIKAKGPLVDGLMGGMMRLSGLVKKTFKINPGKAMFHSVLDKASLATVRICISGGGPLAPSIFRKYNQLGIDFVQGYGLTETSPIITLNPIDHYKETSVGKIIPHCDMKILSPDASGVGEIIVKGPMVMQGYYAMPEETAAAFTPDGYLLTGDIGYIDSEKYVYITGRAKNMIVTGGGKNVYPEEIENCFQLYDAIDQILVRGYVADAELKTEEIEALLYPNQDWLRDEAGGDYAKAEALLKTIVETVNSELLPYQRIIRTTVLREPLAMTTTKKVKRFSA